MASYPPFRIPAASAVPPADVQCNVYASARNAFQRGVVSRNRVLELLIRIGGRLASSVDAVSGQDNESVRGVELDVIHAFRDKPFNLVAGDLRKILQQFRVSGIELFRDGLPYSWQA